MSTNDVKRTLALIGFGALIAAGSLATPQAHAAPGACVYGQGGGFGGGGYCDGPMQANGTFYHCETVYVLGFGGTNCFFVRPVPVEVDPRGWVPA